MNASWVQFYPVLMESDAGAYRKEVLRLWRSCRRVIRRKTRYT